jgi:hypothetical protein
MAQNYRFSCLPLVMPDVVHQTLRNKRETPPPVFLVSISLF